MVVNMSAPAYKASMLDGRSIRAARSLLGWSQLELCKRAGISRATLNDLENNTGDPRRSSQSSVEETLRKSGIEFWDDGEWIGAKLRKNVK